MALSTTLLFDLLTRNKSSKPLADIEKSAGKTRRAFGAMGAGVSAAGRGVAGASKIIGGAALAAGAGIAIFAKGAIAEAEEGAKVGKTTVAIVKATGGAAKITADQVGNLATAISNKTGKDDEAVQSGANMLLTFKNVRNEAGKGSDIFNRATKAAVDLSAAGFGSIEGGSKMLGKALNDPLKGISALSKAGVTFTDQQKEQIKTLVESGDVLGAQKIIMKEVESQVGGVAAASGSASEKMAVAWGNAKEAIGEKLLPVVDLVSQQFVSKIPAAVDKVGAVIGKLGPVFSQAAVFAKAFINGLSGGSVGGGGPLAAFGTAGAMVRDIVMQFFATLQSNMPAIKAFATQLMQFAQAAAPIVTAAIKTIITVVGQIRATVLPIITQVMGTLVSAFRENMPVIKEALTTVTTIVKDAVQLIKIVWAKISPYVLPILKTVFGVVVKTVGSALKIVSGAIKLVLSLIKGDWSGAWKAIKQILSATWQGIKAIVGGALSILKTLFGGAVSAIGRKMSEFWTGVKRKWGEGLAWVKGIPGKIKNAFVNANVWLLNAGKNIIRGLINGIRNMAGKAISAAKGVVKDAMQGAKKLLGISSPSRAWAEIGRNTVLGLANSLRANAGMVDAPLKRLSKRMTLAPTLRTGPGGLGGGMSGSGGVAGRPIVVKLIIGDSELGEIIIDPLRRTVRKLGGNVQAALGTG